MTSAIYIGAVAYIAIWTSVAILFGGSVTAFGYKLVSWRGLLGKRP